MGYSEAGEGDGFVFSGPEFELRLEPVGDNARGVRHMKMKVRRIPETLEYRLGNSTLIFNDDLTASWSF
jgi:hypothetical protein